MKIFWSWQSDTSGKVGRHFVRDALNAAVKTLKEAEDIEEPGARESRDALHVDQDRQGVPGSPDLVATIFDKIGQATVFVADVTFIGHTDTYLGSTNAKHLINPNVAIELGYALRALGDSAILMVQNTFYGDRDGLPFDLRHKAGPIQYKLAPDATKDEIKTESTRLQAVLVNALTHYLTAGRQAASTEPFLEMPATSTIAYFWKPDEVLARAGSTSSPEHRHPSEDADSIEYRFNEPRALYLRLIPTQVLPSALSITTMTDLVQKRQVEVLTAQRHGRSPDRNRFGPVIFVPVDANAVPLALTQLFRNGEIWGVSREMVQQYQGNWVVPMVSVRDSYIRTLGNFTQIAKSLGVRPPYQVEFGAVGLEGIRLSLPQPTVQHRGGISDPIYEASTKLRLPLKDVNENWRVVEAVDAFIRQLYDLAAIPV